MVKSWLKNKIEDLHPSIDFDILTPPNPELGDYSVNLAFVLAKSANGGSASGGKNPKDLAAELAEKFSKNEDFKKYFSRIEPAGGFVNFYLSEDFLKGQIAEVIGRGGKFGNGENKNFKINLEFVSGNPTGPLTVGNARAASFGDALGNIMKKSGYDVAKEYYVNDVGNQVVAFAKSVINDEKTSKGQAPVFELEKSYVFGVHDTMMAVKKELGENLDTKPIEDVIEKSVKHRMEVIEESLKNAGVVYDEIFYESELHKSGEVKDAMELLKKSGRIFEKEGAVWLKHGQNEEDVAVLVKSDENKSTTYLMNDIAYTRNKLEKRKFDKAINVWGTDHHGDVPRLKGGMEALGFNSGRLEILLHQLVAIKRGGELVRISKRAGNVETLDDLLKDVGKDAVRFFFLMKDLNTHMEFDIDLAKEQSKKNPVFYIQYAYARLNQIFNKASALGGESGGLKVGAGGLEFLKEKEEFLLMRKMARFPEIIEDISQNYQVHHLAQYTLELAGEFHNFYEKHRVVNDSKDLENARLTLCRAVAGVLEVCLGLMGVSAPKRMDSPEGKTA